MARYPWPMAIDRDAFERKTSDIAITRTLGFAGLFQLAHEFIKGMRFSRLPKSAKATQAQASE